MKQQRVLPFPARFIVGAVITCSLVGVRDARADPWDFCARVRNDDRVKVYDPALRPDFMRAFKRVFPTVKGTQSDAALKARAVFRCMDGKLVACFIGSVSPCGKIERFRDNAEADAFCRGSPRDVDVPRDVTGLASEFTYRCRSGHADISGTAWVVDDRGFAKRLWTPLDSD